MCYMFSDIKIGYTSGKQYLQQQTYSNFAVSDVYIYSVVCIFRSNLEKHL